MAPFFGKALVIFAGLVIFTGVSAFSSVLFTPATQIQAAGAPTGWNAAQAATIQLDMDSVPDQVAGAGGSAAGFSESTVTGVMISKEGYLLSALHGFYDCLIENGAATRLPIDGGPDFVYTIDTAKAAHVKCKAFVPGRDALELSEVQVVATGPGWIPPKFNYGAHLKKAAELFNDGYGEAGDFIILKLPRKSLACAKSTVHFLEGPVSVWSLGFPVMTARRNGHDSDGETLYYSQGELSARAEDVQCMKPTFENPATRNFMNWYYNQPSIRWTSLDASYGSSGSPVFDDRGILQAMAVIINDNGTDPRFRFCPATGVISVNVIRAVTEALYGEETARKAFDCQ